MNFAFKNLYLNKYFDSGRLPVVDLLLRKGISTEVTYSGGYTALYAASSQGNIIGQFVEFVSDNKPANLYSLESKLRAETHSMN